MALKWPTNDALDAFLDDTIAAIGREVTFVSISGYAACSGCSLDPVTNTSTDSFCSICGGDYWLPNYVNTILSGHVRWRSSDQLGWTPGGQIFDGDCQVRVNYAAGIEDLIDNTKSVLVDGKDLWINEIKLKGSPQINRVVVILKEREKDDD